MDNVTAAARAGHVNGLHTELTYLKAQPKPDAARIAQVEADLDRYAETPSKARRETAGPAAVPAPVPSVQETGEHTEHTAGKPAPRKAAAKKAAPRKAAAKKA